MKKMCKRCVVCLYDGDDDGGDVMMQSRDHQRLRHNSLIIAQEYLLPIYHHV